MTDTQLLAFLTLSPTALAANPGDTHNLTWNFNSSSQGFQFLAPGESLVLKYTIQATDGHQAGTATKVLTVTINGTETGDPNNYDGANADGTGQNSTLTSDLYTIYVGTDGTDNIATGNHNNAIYGKAGDDILQGDNSTDYIYGGSGNDTIGGGNSGDHLYGGLGDDVISGQTASDTVVGGYGADTLFGNTGNDAFQYWSVNDAGDVILDYTPGGDRLDFVVATGSTHTIDGTVFAGGFDFANQTTSAEATVITVNSLELGTKSIAGADVIVLYRHTQQHEFGIRCGQFPRSSERDIQWWSSDGGLYYTSTGEVGIYYDADADSSGGVVLLATLQNVSSTSGLASDFHFIV